ncbi:MAG: hypothetical protein CL546_00620 [Alcanivorax sp.]|nr:hypothetical protein [Alcanivorax sp.]HCP55865.1 hypothetical protein [Pseudomonas sp.]
MALHSINMPSSRAVKECLDLLKFMFCQCQKNQAAYSSKPPWCVNLILIAKPFYLQLVAKYGAYAYVYLGSLMDQACVIC